MKSRRAKACDFSAAVKQAIYARDKGLCVLCGKPGLPNAHFIPRSHNGLGIEENGITLCPACHHRYDNTADRKALRLRLESYLKSKYEDWNEENLYYRKANT